MNNSFFLILEGVFIARGKEDALVTRNLVAGESVYGEKRISVEVSIHTYIHYIVHVHMLQFISKTRYAGRLLLK